MNYRIYKLKKKVDNLLYYLFENMFSSRITSFLDKVHKKKKNNRIYKNDLSRIYKKMVKGSKKVVIADMYDKYHMLSVLDKSYIHSLTYEKAFKKLTYRINKEFDVQKTTLNKYIENEYQNDKRRIMFLKKHLKIYLNKDVYLIYKK